MSSELSKFKPGFESKPSCLAHIAIAFAFAGFLALGLCLLTCSGVLDGEGITITYTPMEDLSPEQRDSLVIMNLEMQDAKSAD